MRRRLLVSLALTLGLVSQARAAVPLRTEAVHPANQITAAMNARLADKYKPLAPLLKEPNAFFETMQARFAEQRRVNPADPYRFDYSELGMPLVRDLQKQLGERIEKTSASARGAQRDAALDYLRDLKAEADRHVAAGHVSYRDFVEFSFFAARAMGSMDQKKVPAWQRGLLHIDRALQGYAPLSVEKEHAMYKARAFSVYQKRSTSPSLRDAAPGFERAFHNPDRLESLWVPTNTAIDTDVLMRLMPKNIEVIGVTGEPIMADGFLRPGGDFWMHDVRHSSVKFQKRARYMDAHKLDEKQTRALDAKSEAWLEELDKAMAAERDPELRNAIKMLSFNFHHDRGFVVAPSEWLGMKHRLWVPGLLYLTQKVGGEPVSFHQPVRYFREANQWLTRFWQARAPEEQAIWQQR